MLYLDVASASHRGRVRSANQDAIAVYNPQDPRWQQAKGSVFAVADGMDGHRPGHVASRLAADNVMRAYYHDPPLDPVAGLHRAVGVANRVIGDQARRLHWSTGVGTTLVTAVVRENRLAVANVGDSRAYLIRGPWITQITRDHSWIAEEVAAGGLTPEDARRHPWRNMITRALTGEPVEADVFEMIVEPGDAILLCSDGLTDLVRDHEIWRIVRRHRPQQATQRLIQLANRRGGHDNITVLLIGVHQRSNGARRRAARHAPPRYPAYQPGIQTNGPRHSAPSLLPLVKLASGLSGATAVILYLMSLFSASPQ